MTVLKRSGPVGAVVLFWALVFFSRFWEADLKMDAMTHAVLAKKILQTGQWTRLFYSKYAYAEFYQHPPLMIWLEALVFKLFGTSTFTARLLPALAGLATVLGLIAWGKLARSTVFGLVAALILLTTSRYLKYGTDVYLDGMLAMGIVWGGVCLLRAITEANTKKNTEKFTEKSTETKLGRWFYIWSALFGVFVAQVFMTKGIAGLSLPLAAFVFACLQSAPRRALGAWCVGMGVALALVSVWLFAADGLHFLRQYFAISVGPRLMPGEGDYFAPFRSLLKSYWPWFPFWGVGAVLLVKTRGLKGVFEGPMGLALMTCFCILGALSSNPFFLEHYLVSWFPTAALVAAWPLARFAERAGEQFVTVVQFVALGLGVVLNVAPISLHQTGDNPFKNAVEWIGRSCQKDQLREVLISNQAADQWGAMAHVLWRTDAEAHWVDLVADPYVGREGFMLITRSGDHVPESWESASEWGRGAIEVWVAKNSKICTL